MARQLHQAGRRHREHIVAVGAPIDERVVVRRAGVGQRHTARRAERRVFDRQPVADLHLAVVDLSARRMHDRASHIPRRSHRQHFAFVLAVVDQTLDVVQVDRRRQTARAERAAIDSVGRVVRTVGRRAADPRDRHFVAVAARAAAVDRDRHHGQAVHIHVDLVVAVLALQQQHVEARVTHERTGVDLHVDHVRPGTGRRDRVRAARTHHRHIHIQVSRVGDVDRLDVVEADLFMHRRAGRDHEQTFVVLRSGREHRCVDVAGQRQDVARTDRIAAVDEHPNRTGCYLERVRPLVPQ